MVQGPMQLNELVIKSSYRKISDDIAEDFYIPCMKASSRYDRISGYFGSTIYIVAWKGLKSFVCNNHGVMRIICSPYLSQEDYDAIRRGTIAKEDPTLANILFSEMKAMFAKETLSNPEKVLASLICNGNLEIKIAVGGDSNRLFHDKVGVFHDNAGNSIAFRGTINETFKGLSNDGNFESLDAFTSWEEGKDRSRLYDIENDFELLWHNKIESIRVYSVPESIKEEIRKHYKQESHHWLELIDQIEVTIDKSTQWSADKDKGGRKPRKHQLDALEKWVSNGKRGIFEHATGSGKTFTAMCAIRKELEEGNPVIVLVPSIGLLEQWRDELKATLKGMDIQYLLCGSNYSSWKHGTNLNSWTKAGLPQKRVTIAVMDTACNGEFLSKVAWSDKLFVVADEVHRMGSPSRRQFMTTAVCGARLGLSATPKRFGDSIGTQAIITFFGEIIQPPYTLKNAIDDGVLTRYFYHPREVNLTETEQQEWDEITKQIKMQYIRMSANERKNSMSNTRFKMLLLRRARIMKQAANKIQIAKDIIANHYENGQRWIVYCEDKTQLDQVALAIQAAGVLNVIRYYADMPGDRIKALEYFDTIGGIVVSIKCLDEGIDIPSTTHALILASSKNPREFIQRRGRILRRHYGKNYASLYDTIVVPENINSNIAHDTIVEGELSRAIQFGDWAENKTGTAILKMIAQENDINYNSLIEEGGEDDE